MPARYGPAACQWIVALSLSLEDPTSWSILKGIMLNCMPAIINKTDP